MEPNKKSELQKPVLTACARLQQLLAQPSEPKKQKNSRIFGAMALSGDIFNGDMRVVTYDEPSHEMIRASAACELALFIASDDPNRYISKEDFIDALVPTNKKSELQKPVLTACARLQQLLSQPPEPVSQEKVSISGVIMGSSGFIPLHGRATTTTYDKPSHDILRALTACKFGLFVAPDNPNRYIPKEDLNATNSFGKSSSKE